jgi:hypothetical protein
VRERREGRRVRERREGRSLNLIEEGGKKGERERRDGE